MSTSFCHKHGWCILHNAAQCICECFEQDAQCDTVIYFDSDGHQSTTRPRNKPRNIRLEQPTGEQNRLSIHTQQDEHTNLYCTETLLHTPDTYIKYHTNRPSNTNKSNKTNNIRNTYIHNLSRTTEKLHFQFPNPGTETWKRCIRLYNQHIVPGTQKTTNKQYIPSLTELFSTTSNENLDTTIKSPTTIQMLSDMEPTRDHPSDDNTSTTSTDGNCITTMDVSNNTLHISQTHSRSSPERKIQNTPSPRSPKPKKTKTMASTEETTDGGPDDGNINNTSRERIFYTFIIHKQYQLPNIKQHQHNRPNQPNFISFDHGDHYHIVYNPQHAKNAAAQRKRIIEFLHGTNQAHTEATITNQIIRNLEHFIQYCLRKGISTYASFGNRTNRDSINKIDTYIKNLKEITKPDIQTDICQQYREQKYNETSKRIKHIKGRHLTDIVEEEIIKNNITNYTEYEQKTDPELKLSLLREFGLQVKSYITEIIKIKKHERNTIIKNTPYELLCHNTVINTTYNKEDHEAIFWLMFYFKHNDINIIDFLAWNTLIKNKALQKINAIVLEGKTNTGKTMITKLLTQILQPERIPRERDNSAFHLDQLPGSNAILFEEPYITPNNVGTWKLLLEGETIKTDIKHRDKEPINRTPIWITTATPIDNYVDNNEKEQIKQRIKIFKFKHEIFHRQETSSGENIPPPPTHLQDKHMHWIYIRHYDKISRAIHNITNQHSTSSEQLQIAHHLKEVLWNTQEFLQRQEDQEKREKSHQTNSPNPAQHQWPNPTTQEQKTDTDTTSAQ